MSVAPPTPTRGVPSCRFPHPVIRSMYYDDQARRFTLMSGLAFGAALGAGVALLLPASPAHYPAFRGADESFAEAVRRGARRLER